jgi:hypothetical protein
LACRPEGRANGGLPLPPRGACQQQVGEVHARDHQEESHRTHQHPERDAKLWTGDPLISRSDAHAEGAVLVLETDAVGDGGQVGECRVDGHAGFETARHEQAVVAPHRVRASEHWHVDVGLAGKWVLRRKYADHRAP